MTSTNFINGNWQPASGARFEAVSPIEETANWSGAASNLQDIETAVAAASDAFANWAGWDLEGRTEIIETYREKLEASRAELVNAICDDAGKPRWEAETEAGAMIGKIAISLQAQAERAGHKEQDTPVGRAVLRHRPHGVVAVFGPYNFPGHLANGHIVPALLAGNAVVFKPSELVPRTAEVMVKCWQEAGLPAGVLNLVQGGGETGRLLAAHNGLDGIFFTGSARTGKLLHRQFGGDPRKILALEMGGNNPLVAWDYGDVEASAALVVLSTFITAGQRCTCARRLIVSDTAEGNALVARVAEIARSLVVGGPNDDPPPFMGPVISARAAESVMASQNGLLKAGAKDILPVTHANSQSAFLTPGLLDVTDVDLRSDEEIFGPLLQVIRVGSFEEAITEANNTAYGLAAGLLAQDKELWQQFQTQICAGIVNWNKQLTGASSTAPFGGIGDSGNHRSSAYYAADYCAYPMASLEADDITMPALVPGMTV